MGEQLSALGVEADGELVRFDEIQSVEAVTPKYDGDSRLMTDRFTIKISVRDYTFRQTPSPPSPRPRLRPMRMKRPRRRLRPLFALSKGREGTVTVAADFLRRNARWG